MQHSTMPRPPAHLVAALRRVAAAGRVRLGHGGMTGIATPGGNGGGGLLMGATARLLPARQLFAAPAAAAAAARRAASTSSASFDGDDDATASSSASSPKVAPKVRTRARLAAAVDQRCAPDGESPTLMFSPPFSTKKKHTPIQSTFPKVSPAVAAHWDALLADLQRPAAVRLAARCDTGRALGLPPSVRLTGLPSLIIGEAKAAHPTKVALARVGEFYEAYGVDAVLLVEHAGLNPMGDGVPIPKAGCPAGNLRRTLADLVDGAGLSVVVVEEAPLPYAYGRRARAKTRYVGGVVTPACPVYLGAGLAGGAGAGGDTSAAGCDADALPATGAPPVIGVAAGPAGFTVIEAAVDLRTVAVSTGQTEEAVTARLYAGGLAPPLYLHSSAAGFAAAGALPAATTPEAAWEARVAALFRREAGAVARYGGADPVSSLLAAVRRDTGLPPDEPFAVVPQGGVGVGGGGGGRGPPRPHPLPMCTATQLGLHASPGVPSLVDALLPPRGDAAGAGGGRGVGLAARQWLRDLLLRPPDVAVAAGVRAACAELRGEFCLFFFWFGCWDVRAKN
jgi:hypothetical protein